MILSTFKKIFGKPLFFLLSLVAALAVFKFIIFLPNIEFLKSILFNDSISLQSKIFIPIQLLISTFANYTLHAAVYTVFISLLFGIYIGAFTYFIKYRIKEINSSGISFGFLGIVSGIFGMGCAACGAFIFSSVSIASLSGILALSNLGIFFEILGTLLLITAVYITLKKIGDPLICESGD